MTTTMKTDLRFLAQENGLTYIETTSQMNGYPSSIMGAIVDFESYEQAEELANEFGLQIETFEKRDGWNLWYRTGNCAYEPFTNSGSDYGDNYGDWSNGISEEQFFESEVKFALDSFDNFDDIQNFINEKKELFEEIEKADDDEIVITYEGRYYETIKEKSMRFYHDTRHYAIGLIDRNYYDDEEF